MALTPLNLPDNVGNTNIMDDDVDSDSTNFELDLLDEDEEDTEDFIENDVDDEEEELSDSDDVENEELDSDDDDDDDDEDFEDVVDEEDEEDDDEEEQRQQQNSRANDRIRSLVEANKVAQAQAQKEREKRIASEKKMIELQKSTQTSTLNILKNNLKAIKAQMTQAHNEGETEKYIDLQEQLNKTQMDISSLESWEAPELTEAENDEPIIDTSSPTVQKELNEAPEAAQKWFNKNPWFREPKTPEDIERQREAVIYSQILTAKGYNLESDELFEMIDDRLQKLGLAKSEKNKVKSKMKDKTSSVKGRKTKKRKISQTVQGASRSSTSQKSRKTNSKKISLTPEQQNIAELFGMSPAEYAKELLRLEESGSRMTNLT